MIFCVSVENVNAIFIIFLINTPQAVSSLDSASPIRTLVCVDGLNALWSSGSMLRDSDSKPVVAKDVALFHFVRKLTASDWCNAVLVGSLTKKASWNDHRESHLPRYLLGEDGWRALDPFVPVHVDHMNQIELRNFIAYLQDMGWLSNPALKEELVKRELMTLCDGNPKELVSIGAEW